MERDRRNNREGKPVLRAVIEIGFIVFLFIRTC